MPFGRLLLTLIAIAAPAVAQIANPDSASKLTGNNATSSVAAPTAKEPWRIVPEQSPDGSFLVVPQSHAGDNSLQKVARDEGFPLLAPKPDSQHPAISALTQGESARNLLPNGEPGADYFCLSIRSYLVARDAPDSDSTHLVRSSTCQPASRYRLKTAEETQPSLQLQH